MTKQGKRIMKVLHFAVAASLLLVGSCIADAQGKIESGTILSSQAETKPTNCEFNISVLTGAHRVAGDAGLIIMIARLGKGETRRGLNGRRLHNARAFLIEFGHRAPQTIVTAEGERVNGYGRIELYVGGKLFHVLMTNPNDDLAVGACSFEGNDPCTYELERKLYPCLDRTARRPTKKR
jgi:hypothetical protein